MRLIDADALKEFYGKWSNKHTEFLKPEVDLYIDRQPTIDAVPVVRCKDCKHSKLYFFADNGTTRIEQYKCVHHRMGVNVLESDDFCSYGERKDGEGW